MLQVVRYQHQSRIVDGEGDMRTLLFDPRVERGEETRIGDRYRRLDVAARSSDLIVVRGSSRDFAERVEDDDMLRTLTGSTPVLVLAPQTEGGQPVLTAPLWDRTAVPAPSVDELRGAELRCGIEASGAVYRQGGSHYLLPSAAYHAEAFVRLEDALQDFVDLLRLSDWLAYRVGDKTALAADNGSLLALLTTIALRVRDRLAHTPPITTLNEYPIGPTKIADAVESFRAHGWERLLFCVSVNSSGHVAREVDGLEGVTSEVVVLCETRKGAGGDGLERFSRVLVERWDVDETGRCDACPERHLLGVDPRTYEIRAQVRLRSLRPSMRNPEENREFWEAAERQGAVALHVEGRRAEGHSPATRHLAVAFDVPKLLADPWFRERCIDALRSMYGERPGPELVLIPKHACTDALSALAREAFPGVEGASIVVAAGDWEDAIGNDLREVLLIDDALISGETLVRLHRAVYERAREARISAFVAINRPSDQADLEHTRLRFSQRPRQGGTRPEPGLHFAQCLLLPDESACPWCVERDLLERRLGDLKGPAHGFVTARLARLRATTGMQSPLLLEGVTHKKMGGSFIGDLGEVAAFAAVSAFAQNLHFELEQDRADETIKVVDLPFLLHAFFDPIIVAGLLRTLPARDLRDPGGEPLVARTIRDRARYYSADTIAELALAAICGGRVPAKPVRKIIEDRDSALAVSLLALLEGF